MRKTRDLLKKIEKYQGNISRKDGQKKGQKGKNLKKEKRLRRDGKNTKNYTKKVLMTWITMMVWSLTQSDILECEVKRYLGSITTSKASAGDGILAELFRILDDDAVKVLQSICQ